MFDPKKLQAFNSVFFFLFLGILPHRKVLVETTCLSYGEQSIPQRFSTLFYTYTTCPFHSTP
ncbi:hypothetical protein AAHE18_09G240600 [Arachis hypogaea]